MIDRAAIFTAILQRQALRREALLPLLDVRAEYDRAVQHALWSAHVEKLGPTVMAQALAELKERHGPKFGGSVGGLWLIRALTAKKLLALFADRSGEGQ